MLNSLGVVLLVQGKPHEATQVLRRAVLVYDSLESPEPEEHARTLSNCAGALLAEGNVAESLKFAARELHCGQTEVRQPRLRNDLRITAASVSSLGVMPLPRLLR